TPAPSTGPRQEAVKTNPGFLTSLLERFTHRPAVQPSATTVTPDRPTSQPEPGLGTKPEATKTPVPESKPILPVTVKKETASVSKVEPRAELPASETPLPAPDKAPDKKTATLKNTKSKVAPKDKAATSSKGKKPVVKLKKSPEDTIPVEPLDEKKKITE
ncbi:MAG: hypothetical protein ACXWNC_09965, partial [Anaerolineales bacterium]